MACFQIRRKYFGRIITECIGLSVKTKKNFPNAFLLSPVFKIKYIKLNYLLNTNLLNQPTGKYTYYF